MAYNRWPKYVTVAQRRGKAAKAMQKLKKEGKKIEPIQIEGRKIARTFWGVAWCDHLEKFSDYENRLPRGRTYVRNGSVCHLAISKGRVEAIVSGSELYNIKIDIAPLPAKKWKRVRDQCTGQIGSMLELLQGRFSDQVMKIITDQQSGLFPQPGEIKLACNCLDWAGMCKHIAATLYGVGAKLDQQPELLFLLRNVDQEELITAELDITSATKGKEKGRRLVTSDLSEVFGIELQELAKPSRTKTNSNKKTTKNKPEIKTKKTFTPTAAAVSRLRKQFEMNIAQFATLLGVAPATVYNWESGSGKLKLRQRTLEALIQASKLTPKQAMKSIQNPRRQ